MIFFPDPWPKKRHHKRRLLRPDFLRALAAKVRAGLMGKVTPDLSDVKEMALPVIRHRIVTSYNAEAENVFVGDIVDKLISDLE